MPEFVAHLKKRRTPLSQQTISNYERTGRVPPRNWRFLADALDVPYEELVAVLAEASEERSQSADRETQKVVGEVKALAESLGRFTSRYEELGHTYRRLDETTERMADAIEQLTKQQAQILRLLQKLTSGELNHGR